MSNSATKSALYIPHSGPSLLETPLLNKGSAFSSDERITFNLTGLIPPRYETIKQTGHRLPLPARLSGQSTRPSGRGPCDWEGGAACAIGVATGI